MVLFHEPFFKTVESTSHKSEQSKTSNRFQNKPRLFPPCNQLTKVRGEAGSPRDGEPAEHTTWQLISSYRGPIPVGQEERQQPSTLALTCDLLVFNTHPNIADCVMGLHIARGEKRCHTSMGTQRESRQPPANQGKWPPGKASLLSP